MSVTVFTNLEMMPGGVCPVLHCSQGDIRPFGFNIKWNGQAYSPTGTCVVAIVKKDGNAATVEGTIDGDKVTFETTPQMTVLDGDCAGIVTFVDGDNPVSTLRFVLAVQKDPTVDAVESESDPTGWQSIMAEAEASIAAAKSWAVGPSGSGEGTDTNNAKYWAEIAQAKTRLNMYGGKTLAFNQLQKNTLSRENNGITYTFSNGTLTASGRAESGSWWLPSDEQYKLDFVTGHKYYINVGNDSYVGNFSVKRWYVAFATAITLTSPKEIITATETGAFTFHFLVYSGNEIDETYKPQIFDLTLMFGAGNEPTVDEFNALFPEEYYPYTTGELKSAQANKVKIIGFNKWDEEWENGWWNYSTGVFTASNNFFACKNKIPVIPNTVYFFQCPSNVRELQYYDINGNPLGRRYSYTEGTPPATFTTPNNCYFITFYFGASYGNTYKHDICINISNPSLNGTYEPYHADIKSIPAEVIALDGYGWSAGTVYNSVEWVDGRAYFHKRVASVDLGTLTWTQYNLTYPNVYLADIPDKADGQSCQKIMPKYEYTNTWATVRDNNGYYRFAQSPNETQIQLNDNYNTVEDFTSAMNGVMLYYELATEEVTEITNLFPENFNLFAFAGDTSFEFVDSSIAWVIPYNMENILKANEILYDNSVSGLSATNVQAAINELYGLIQALTP